MSLEQARLRKTPSIGGVPYVQPPPKVHSVSIPPMPLELGAFLGWLIELLSHSVTNMGMQRRRGLFEDPSIEYGPSRRDVSRGLTDAAKCLAQNTDWLPKLVDIDIVGVPEFLLEFRDNINGMRPLNKLLVEQVRRRLEVCQSSIKHSTTGADTLGRTVKSRKIAKSAGEAEQMVGASWATTKQLADVFGTTPAAMRGRLKRAGKNILSSDKKPFEFRGRRTASHQYRIQGVWPHISGNNER